MAGLNDTLLNIGNAAMQTAAAYASLHTAQPNASGSNESAAARQAITWVTAANGDLVATADLAVAVGSGRGNPAAAGAGVGTEPLRGLPGVAGRPRRRRDLFPDGQLPRPCGPRRGGGRRSGRGAFR